MSRIVDLLDASHRKLLRPSGGCHNCPRKRVDFVPATLAQAQVIIVGEAPGATEVEEQEGFVGSSGQLLRRELKDHGITDFALTNVVHCRPPKNATPKPREVECCLSQFVLDEVRGYPVVVLAGNVALQAFFPRAKANRYRGNVAWHPDFPGQRFYNIYHPSYLLRRKDLTDVFSRQIGRLARILKEDPATPPPWTTHTGGGDAYWAALKEALAAPLISLDIETNKLESWHIDARIVSLALTATGKDVVYAYEDEPHFIGTLEAVRDYLRRPEKIVVGHNTGFDLDFLERDLDFRVKVQGIHDTQSIWYEAGQYRMASLKELTSRELDGYRWLVHAPGEATDTDLLGRYNGEDVVRTLELFRRGMTKVKPRTRDLLSRVSGPVGLQFRRISTNGIHLRRDYWRQKQEEYVQKERDVLKAWREEDPQFVPTEHEAGNGLQHYLYRLKGLPVVKRTDKGAPSTDEGTVKQLIREEGATYLRHLQTLRKIEKIRSTYLDAYEQHVTSQSLIHSGYTTTWTDSARSSSRGPNLQNIPRAAEIRDLFGPRPGGILLESDFSQIEFRIMVCLAQDPTGIAAYARGEDAHTQTARSFSGGLEPTKEQRTWAKVVNFALCYGGDAYKVQQWARNQYGLDWSLADAERFVGNFWNTYARLPAFHRACEEKLTRNRGWFESVTGHVFHYRDWDHPNKGKRDHAYRSALNAEAQGPAAQICFLTMIYFDRLLQERGLGSALLVNHVHDSIMVDIPEAGMVDPVVRTMEDAKDMAYEWVKPWFVVPLVMDHEVGSSWGSLKPWKAAA